jgi:hypothetical protein
MLLGRLDSHDVICTSINNLLLLILTILVS